jgi:hypothetical protein
MQKLAERTTIDKRRKEGLHERVPKMPDSDFLQSVPAAATLQGKVITP